MADNHSSKKTGTKTAVSEPHYFSERLKRKLDRLQAFSSAIIEAPPGYGKTTAVHDYLKGCLPQDANIHWFTAVDEAPDAGFRRLCREIGKIDSHARERLIDIGLPNAFTIGEICDALRSIKCDRETWLVLDNFQLLCAGLPPAFLTALLERDAPELHIIIITRTMSRDMHTAVAGRGFLHVTASDLRLEADDILRYYVLAGVDVAPQEAEKVLHYTNGWIIAVYLQLCAFRETGAFSDTAVSPLMEKLIWNKLSDAQQAFFLQLSPFETATPRQMCALLGCDVLPEYALEALSGPFVRYDHTRQCYEPHSILFELVNRKRAERGRVFERNCLLRAGDLCRDEGRIAEALGFYMHTAAYEQILALDLSPLIFETIGNTPFSIIAQDIAKRCPAQIRRNRPLGMLCVAWALKAAGLDAEFNALLAELDEQLDESGPLRAEWLLLSAYRHYPRLDKMLPALRKASPLFNGSCSQVILPEAPWAFGGYYQLTEFHLQAGAADREAACFEEFIALYAGLTGGHGSGADALFRAELAHLRNDMAAAEIFAHKAVFLAESKQQSIVQLGAAMTLANIALLKADTAGWQDAVSLMERVASRADRNIPLVRTVLDTVHGSLLVELCAQTRIAAWLKSRDFPSHLPPPVTLNALYVHTVFLLHQGDLARFLGVLEALPPEVKTKSAYGEFSLLLMMAAGYALTGNHARAADFFERAAAIGLPDGFILHFAAYSKLFADLAAQLIAQKQPTLLAAYQTLKEQFENGWGALHKAVAAGELPAGLTAREHEIARLAADGMRNNEIAKRLFVTESTVRTHLRAIFQKLDIDRRAKLAEKLN